MITLKKKLEFDYAHFERTACWFGGSGEQALVQSLNHVVAGADSSSNDSADSIVKRLESQLALFLKQGKAFQDIIARQQELVLVHNAQLPPDNDVEHVKVGEPPKELSQEALKEQPEQKEVVKVVSTKEEHPNEESQPSGVPLEPAKELIRRLGLSSEELLVTIFSAKNPINKEHVRVLCRISPGLGAPEQVHQQLQKLRFNVQTGITRMQARAAKKLGVGAMEDAGIHSNAEDTPAQGATQSSYDAQQQNRELLQLAQMQRLTSLLDMNGQLRFEAGMSIELAALMQESASWEVREGLIYTLSNTPARVTQPFITTQLLETLNTWLSLGLADKQWSFLKRMCSLMQSMPMPRMLLATNKLLHSVIALTKCHHQRTAHAAHALVRYWSTTYEGLISAASAAEKRALTNSSKSLAAASGFSTKFTPKYIPKRPNTDGENGEGAQHGDGESQHAVGHSMVLGKGAHPLKPVIKASHYSTQPLSADDIRKQKAKQHAREALYKLQGKALPRVPGQAQESGNAASTAHDPKRPAGSGPLPSAKRQATSSSIPINKSNPLAAAGVLSGRPAVGPPPLSRGALAEHSNAHPASHSQFLSRSTSHHQSHPASTSKQLPSDQIYPDHVQADLRHGNAHEADMELDDEVHAALVTEQMAAEQQAERRRQQQKEEEAETAVGDLPEEAKAALRKARQYRARRREVEDAARLRCRDPTLIKEMVDITLQNDVRAEQLHKKRTQALQSMQQPDPSRAQALARLLSSMPWATPPLVYPAYWTPVTEGVTSTEATRLGSRPPGPIARPTSAFAPAKEPPEGERTRAPNPDDNPTAVIPFAPVDTEERMVQNDKIWVAGVRSPFLVAPPTYGGIPPPHPLPVRPPAGASADLRRNMPGGFFSLPAPPLQPSLAPPYVEGVSDWSTDNRYHDEHDQYRQPERDVYDSGWDAHRSRQQHDRYDDRPSRYDELDHRRHDFNGSGTYRSPDNGHRSADRGSDRYETANAWNGFSPQRDELYHNGNSQQYQDPYNIRSYEDQQHHAHRDQHLHPPLPAAGYAPAPAAAPVVYAAGASAGFAPVLVPPAEHAAPTIVPQQSAVAAPMAMLPPNATALLQAQILGLLQQPQQAANPQLAAIQAALQAQSSNPHAQMLATALQAMQAQAVAPAVAPAASPVTATQLLQALQAQRAAATAAAAATTAQLPPAHTAAPLVQPASAPQPAAQATQPQSAAAAPPVMLASLPPAVLQAVLARAQQLAPGAMANAIGPPGGSTAPVSQQQQQGSQQPSQHAMSSLLSSLGHSGTLHQA